MDNLRGCSAAGRPTVDHPKDHQRHPRRCQVSTQRVKVLEAELPLVLMRFLSLRLKPKAAATPRVGTGPGTEETWLRGGKTRLRVASTFDISATNLEAPTSKLSNDKELMLPQPSK